MSKKNKKPYPGKKKNSVTSIVMRVFEKNPESELSHKQVSSLVDAKDPASRQLVFDCLNQLATKGALRRINHYTFVLSSTENLTEGTLSI